MPELMVDLITSLDGYASAEGWPGWWGLEGPEYLGWLEEQPEDGLPVLMGATTYRLMSQMSRTPQGAASSARGGRQPDRARRHAEGGLLVDPDRAAGLAEHPAGHHRRGRGGARDEGRGRPLAAHPGQPQPVPLAARRRAGRPVPAGRLPGHHRARPVQERVYDGYPTSRSSWSRAAPSTAARSCSTTCRRCSTARPAAAGRVGRTQR